MPEVKGSSDPLKKVKLLKGCDGVIGVSWQPLRRARIWEIVNWPEAWAGKPLLSQDLAPGPHRYEASQDLPA